MSNHLIRKLAEAMKMAPWDPFAPVRAAKEVIAELDHQEALAVPDAYDWTKSYDSCTCRPWPTPSNGLQHKPACPCAKPKAPEPQKCVPSRPASPFSTAVLSLAELDYAIGDVVDGNWDAAGKIKASHEELRRRLADTTRLLDAATKAPEHASDCYGTTAEPAPECPVCAGPNVDARDCPVHAQDVAKPPSGEPRGAVLSEEDLAAAIASIEQGLFSSRLGHAQQAIFATFKELRRQRDEALEKSVPRTHIANKFRAERDEARQQRDYWQGSAGDWHKEAIRRAEQLQAAKAKLAEARRLLTEASPIAYHAHSRNSTKLSEDIEAFLAATPGEKPPAEKCGTCGGNGWYNDRYGHFRGGGKPREVCHCAKPTAPEPTHMRIPNETIRMSCVTTTPSMPNVAKPPPGECHRCGPVCGCVVSVNKDKWKQQQARLAKLEAVAKIAAEVTKNFDKYSYDSTNLEPLVNVLKTLDKV